MSITKTTTASASYIVPTVGTTLSYTPSGQADVTGVQPNEFATALSSAVSTTSSFAGSLVPPIRVTRPGIFTAGTPQEGTLSNPTNDSNS